MFWQKTEFILDFDSIGAFPDLCGNLDYNCSSPTVDSRYLEIEGTLKKTVRNIRTSTYQICGIEEKNNLNNQILQMTI